MDVDSVQSFASRRWLRRLGQFSRDERPSVAMPLAESTHCSALRRPKQARAGEEESEVKYKAEFRKTLSLRWQAPSTTCLKTTQERCLLPGGRTAGQCGSCRFFPLQVLLGCVSSELTQAGSFFWWSRPPAVIPQECPLLVRSLEEHSFRLSIDSS